MSNSTHAVAPDVMAHFGALSPLGLMTPGEAASMLLVDANTVARWSDKGRFRSVRTPGGHRRYFAADVLEFARRRSR